MRWTFNEKYFLSSWKIMSENESRHVSLTPSTYSMSDLSVVIRVNNLTFFSSQFKSSNIKLTTGEFVRIRDEIVVKPPHIIIILLLLFFLITNNKIEVCASVLMLLRLAIRAFNSKLVAMQLLNWFRSSDFESRGKTISIYCKSSKYKWFVDIFTIIVYPLDLII